MNGRINAWMAKRSEKVQQVSVKNHLVLSLLSGDCGRNKGGGQQAPRGAEDGGTLTKTLTLTQGKEQAPPFN